jgi:signal recognition particle GTPase
LTEQTNTGKENTMPRLRINPLIARESKTLRWTINGGQDARSNLLSALAKIAKMAEQIESKTLKPTEHDKTKETLKEALHETGLSLAGALLLKEELESTECKKRAEELKERDKDRLMRETLRLMENLPRVRCESHKSGEAWVEVETQYCAKVSLYRAVLARKTTTP